MRSCHFGLARKILPSVVRRSATKRWPLACVRQAHRTIATALDQFNALRIIHIRLTKQAFFPLIITTKHFAPVSTSLAQLNASPYDSIMTESHTTESTVTGPYTLASKVGDFVVCAVSTGTFARAYVRNDAVVLDASPLPVELALQTVATLGQATFYKIVSKSQIGHNLLQIAGAFTVLDAERREQYSCEPPPPGGVHTLLLVDERGRPNGSWIVAGQCKDPNGSVSNSNSHPDQNRSILVKGPNRMHLPHRPFRHVIRLGRRSKTIVGIPTQN